MLTRRALLLLGAGALSGCSVDSLRPPHRAPKPDPDEALTRSVVASITAARAQAEGTPYAAVHDAHLAALDAPPATGTTASPQLPQIEAALQHTLLHACQRARSGRLAMLLASMAAGVAQVAA